MTDELTRTHRDDERVAQPPGHHDARGSREPRGRASGSGVTALLAGLAGVAGIIHVLAAIEHLDDGWTLVVFFALVATGQLLGAWWIYHRPDDQRVLGATAVVNVAVALLWIFSRTTSLPFGPDAGRVISVGAADTIATLQELTFAMLVAAVLWQPERRQRRLGWLSSPMGTRLTYAILSATLFVAALGGHKH